MRPRSPRTPDPPPGPLHALSRRRRRRSVPPRPLQPAAPTPGIHTCACAERAARGTGRSAVLARRSTVVVGHSSAESGGAGAIFGPKRLARTQCGTVWNPVASLRGRRALPGGARRALQRRGGGAQRPARLGRARPGRGSGQPRQRVLVAGRLPRCSSPTSSTRWPGIANAAKPTVRLARWRASASCTKGSATTAAQARLQEALALYRAAGNRHGEGVQLVNLGTVHRQARPLRAGGAAP